MIVLQFPNYEYSFLKFNQYTNPGWFCTLIWLFFGIYISGTFIDNLEIKSAKEYEKILNKDIDETDNIFNNEKIQSNENSQSLKKSNPKSNEVDKSTSVSSNMIEYDIQNLIREQETTFSYMSISFLLLVIILLFIRVNILIFNSFN